eukprot:TRINITY_DN2777_c0_g1_i1.p1 TRINITY_DN2777_c0_g1~~TRINITY_DN2777_c0_g1_i1.p1  ORF type:complete len:195 (-),score=45.08 TRINITY_DN2777_c0_g1_i1:316-816(-)
MCIRDSSYAPAPVTYGPPVQQIAPVQYAPVTPLYAQPILESPVKSIEFKPVQFENTIVDYQHIPVGYEYQVIGERRYVGQPVPVGQYQTAPTQAPVGFAPTAPLQPIAPLQPVAPVQPAYSTYPGVALPPASTYPQPAYNPGIASGINLNPQQDGLTPLSAWICCV